MRGGSSLVLSEIWALLPLLVVLPWLTWRHRAGSPIDLVARALLACYLAVLVGLTFFPLPLPPYEPASGFQPDLNLRPFRHILATLQIGPDLGSQAVRLLLGNILAFIPLGVLIPLVRPAGHSFGRVLAAGLLLSAGIELGQLLLSLLMGFSYRFTDVDDVILNVSGALLGYLGFRLAVGLQRAVEHVTRAS